MPKSIIDKERCKGCELCLTACPKGIIEMSKELNKKGYFPAQVIDQSRCTGCKACATICPDVAITVYGRVKKNK